MSFRARIAVAAAAAVALAVVLASALVYVVVREPAPGAGRRGARARAQRRSRTPLRVIPDTRRRGVPRAAPGVRRGGRLRPARRSRTGHAPCRRSQDVDAAGDDRRARRRGERGERRSGRDRRRRARTSACSRSPYGPDAAVQVARPLTEVDDVARRIGVLLLVIARGGIGVAAVLGPARRARGARLR